MTVRWPFKAAVVLLVVGLAAWVAVPRVESAWRDHQARKDIAARMVAMGPTAEVLLRVVRPEGVQNCGQTEWTRLNGDLCWQGPQSPGRAALAMASELRRVGATGVDVRCVVRQPNGHAFCGVHAGVAGRTWAAMVYPPSATSGGFRLSGNAFFGGDFPGSGTPVPPEQA